LEEEIQGLFPNARLARMDLDTTRRKDAYQHIIDRFARHEVDILIGTQMVTKGLHFDDVSLVVVLQADMLVNQPDFRSTEYAFQMLEQVSGRAGRSGKQGEVMIQTFDPKNPLYTMLCAHDFKGIYQQQVSEREMFYFPPFHRLMMITLRHRDERRLEHCSRVLMQALQDIFGTRVSSVITPQVSRRNNQYIRQLRLRVEQGANIRHAKQLLRECIHLVLQQTDCKGTVVFVDVDP
jgi:primosomal protein N' (replication factor Y)